MKSFYPWYDNAIWIFSLPNSFFRNSMAFWFDEILHLSSSHVQFNVDCYSCCRPNHLFPVLTGSPDFRSVSIQTCKVKMWLTIVYRKNSDVIIESFNLNVVYYLLRSFIGVKVRAFSYSNKNYFPCKNMVPTKVYSLRWSLQTITYSL